MCLLLTRQLCKIKSCNWSRVAGRHAKELATLRGKLEEAVTGQGEGAKGLEVAPSSFAAAGDTNAVEEEVGRHSYMHWMLCCCSHVIRRHLSFCLCSH